MLLRLAPAVHSPSVALGQRTSSLQNWMCQPGGVLPTFHPPASQGVGHIPMDECPGRLNELLINFVRQELGAAVSSGAPR